VEQGAGQKQEKTLQSALVAAVDMQHEQEQQQNGGYVDDDMQVDDVQPLQDQQQQQQQQQGPKRALSLPKLDQQDGQEGASR
jgi:hypothetical protein